MTVAEFKCSGLGVLWGGTAGGSISCCDGLEVCSRLLVRSVHISRFAKAPTSCPVAWNIQTSSPMLGWALAGTIPQGTMKPEQGSCFYKPHGALLQNWLQPVFELSLSGSQKPFPLLLAGQFFSFKSLPHLLKLYLWIWLLISILTWGMV